MYPCTEKTHRCTLTAMNTPSWFGLLILMAACGSPPEAIEPAEEAPATPDAEEAPPEPALATMDCPEDASYREGQGAQGIEQYCEKDGIMHGPIRKYYANGNRSAEGSYNEGKTDGTWSWWYEDGKKKSKGSYKKGKQTGGWSWWHESGERAREGDFLNGRKAGQWTSWYDNGRKSEEGLYFNDLKDGEWLYFLDDEDMTVARVEKWSNGTMNSEKSPTPEGDKP